MFSRSSGAPEAHAPSPLERIFSDLGHRNHDVKHSAVLALRHLVESELRALDAERFYQFMTELTARLSDMVRHASLEQRVGGVSAIDELVDVAYDDKEPIIVGFVHAVRHILQTHAHPLLLRMAARTMGHLARAGGALTVGMVEFEVTRALEWLANSPPSNPRRMAAVLVLKEIAEKTPTLFNVYASAFLDAIWVALRDVDVQVRLGGVEALRACLADIAHRDSSWRLECYVKVYKQAQKSFTQKGSAQAAAAIHGSLLTLGELLRYSSDFLASRFDGVCGTVLSFKSNRNVLVRDAVLALLPDLAALNRDRFIELFLEESFAHLVRVLMSQNARPESRDTAFVAVGRLAMSVGDAIVPLLEAVMPIIRTELAPPTSRKRKKERATPVKVLKSVSLLARAVGARLQPFVESVVDEMFGTSLSQPLIDALTDIATHIPALLKPIQDRLLVTIGTVLFSYDVELDPLRQWGGRASDHIRRRNTRLEFLRRRAQADGDVTLDALLAGIHTSDSTKQRVVGGGGTSLPLAPGLTMQNSNGKQTARVPLYGSPLDLLSSGTDTTSSVGPLLPGHSASTNSRGKKKSSKGSSAAQREAAASTPTTRVRLQSKMSTPRRGGDPGPGSPEMAGVGGPQPPMTPVGASSAQMDPAAASSSVLASHLHSRSELVPAPLAPLVLALHTLGSFDFSLRQLLPFVEESVLPFLEHPSPAVRRAAATSCCHILQQAAARGADTLPGAAPRSKGNSSSPNMQSVTGSPALRGPPPPSPSSANKPPSSQPSSSRLHLLVLIFRVISRLVTVAIADVDPSVRLVVLHSLAGEKLDMYLAHHGIVSKLFVALNEEEHLVREKAIIVLGRIAPRNPALVTPPLRRKLIQLLSELRQSSSDSLMQEQSSRLLGQLVGACPSLSRPYVRSILEVLVPKLQDPRDVVTSSTMATLGILSSVGAGEIVPHLPVIVPLAIRTLTEKTAPEKRRVALRALGQIISNTAQVIDPYLRYPELLPSVLKCMHSEGSYEVRKEAQKVLGVLGALDPHRFKQDIEPVIKRQAILRERERHAIMFHDAAADGLHHMPVGADTAHAALDEEELFGADDDDTNVVKLDRFIFNPTALLPSMLPSIEDYYPTVSVGALMRILRDPNLAQHHSAVIKAVMFIFRHLGMKSAQFLPQVIPPFLEEIRNCDPSLREGYFLDLSSLVQIVCQHVRNHKDEILLVCEEYWDNPMLLGAILQVVEEIAAAIRDEYKPHLTRLIPHTMRMIRHDRHLHRESTLHVLHMILVLSSLTSLDHYLYLIVPELVCLAEATQLSVRVRRSAIDTIAHVAKSHDLADYSSRLIQPFTRLLASGAYRLHGSVLKALCVLIHQLGTSYLNFEPMVGKAVAMSRRNAPRSVSKDSEVDRVFQCYLKLHHRINLSRFSSVVAASNGGISASAAPSHLLSPPRLPSPLAAAAASLLGSAMELPASAVSGRDKAMHGSANSFQRYGHAGSDVGNGHQRTGPKPPGAPPPPGGDRAGSSLGGSLVSTTPSRSGMGRDPRRKYVFDGQWLDDHELELLFGDEAPLPIALRRQRRNDVDDVGADADGGDGDGDQQPQQQQQQADLQQLPASSGGDLAYTDKLQFSLQNLRKAWACAQRSTQEDWRAWMHGFSIELLKESPSQPLRACSALAAKYPPLALELFNPSFFSCWAELQDRWQDDLLRALDSALGARNIPPQLVHMILNLAEFMEHNEETLPLNVTRLSCEAERYHAYAKALYYNEQQFQTAAKPTLDALIRINNQLQQPDAAVGVLEFAQTNLNIELREGWFETLERWEEALDMNQRKHMDDPARVDYSLGCMRCLRALGDWHQLAQLAQQLWRQHRMEDLAPPPVLSPVAAFSKRPPSLLSPVNRNVAIFGVAGSAAVDPHSQQLFPAQDGADERDGGGDASLRRQIAQLGAVAAWNLGDWSTMHGYVRHTSPDDFSGTFTRAILSVHHNRFTEAQNWIEASRRLLDAELTSLAREGYARAYHAIVKIQQLAELEEVVQFKQSKPSQRNRIMHMWRQRLGGAQNNTEVWQQLLSVRSLVVEPKQDWENWVNFARLCRKSGRLALSLKVLRSLLDMDPLMLIHPQTPLPAGRPHITVAALRHLWAAGYRQEAYNKMAALVEAMDANADNGLKSHCYLKLGQWVLELDRETRRTAQAKGVISKAAAAATSMPLSSHSKTVRSSSLRRMSGISPTVVVQSDEDADEELVAVPVPLADAGVRVSGASHRSDTSEDEPAGVSAIPPHMSSALRRTSRSSRRGRPGSPVIKGWNAAERQGVQDSPRGARSRSRTPSGEQDEDGQPRRRRRSDQSDGGGGGGSGPSSPRSGVVRSRVSTRPSVMMISDYEIARQKALHYFKRATECDHSSYKAWHAWAVMNFRIVSHYRKKTSQASSTASEVMRHHIVPAIQGFFRSIALQPKEAGSLQDILRLLTLWFEHGEREDVRNAVVTGFGDISVDTWLLVIPQIIARIGTPERSVRELVHRALNEIGRSHPQALVYPLTVASKSPEAPRKQAALEIISALREHSPTLVQQAELVSNELIRVAILWAEMWREHIDNAFRHLLYRRPMDMHATLMPMHERMRGAPETMSEAAFMDRYGQELAQAERRLVEYKRTRKQSDLRLATEQYQKIMRKLVKELTTLTLTDRELQMDSPRLLQAREMELCVPGTYRAGRPVTKISYFEPTMKVIESQQHPRKLRIRGSDGRGYGFLLKGHEDLRQDERVCQLFGLVNTLLRSERETANRELRIHRFEVIPISPNIGLIEWVPHCDTIHALIKQYRNAHNVLLNIEQMLMQGMTQDYQTLTVMQKVEVFEYALGNTSGLDLCRVLYLKSRNAEVWLNRRTCYTRSLAVMSMVGYILGLGDRHTCNVMIDRVSGIVVHIDFGDCFEVAMHREKFPELVPFRLTRMLINAMEVSGIEGSFRTTCECVLTMLREHRESVLAVLEAFVYDPLIKWRLHNASPGAEPDSATSANSDQAAAAGSAGGSGGEGAGAGVAMPEAPMQHRDSPAQPQRDRPPVANNSLAPPDANSDASSASGGSSQQQGTEVNARALRVIRRIEDKLAGTDYGDEPLGPAEQVDRLILEATDRAHLSQLYMGWCPFW